MGWSKYGLTALLLVVQSAVGLVGGFAGYQVDGVPVGGEMSSGSPGILGIVEWVWDSLVFYFHMLTFQVDGMPVPIGAIFIIMGLLTVTLIVNLIRGS